MDYGGTAATAKTAVTVHQEKPSKIVVLVEAGHHSDIGQGAFKIGGGAWALRLRPQLGDRLPVVLMRTLRQPRRHRHAEIPAHGFGVALVKSPHLAETLHRAGVAADPHSVLAERLIDRVKSLRRQTVRQIHDRGLRKYLRQVNQGMARHGKSKLRLP